MSKKKYFDSLFNEWDIILKKKNPYSKNKPCPVCKKIELIKYLLKKN